MPIEAGAVKIIGQRRGWRASPAGSAAGGVRRTRTPPRPTALALDESQIEGLLEETYAAAHAGLLRAEDRGRAGEAPLARDLEEMTQIRQLHTHHKSICVKSNKCIFVMCSRAL